MFSKYKLIYLILGFITFILIILHLIPSLAPLTPFRTVTSLASSTPYTDPKQFTSLRFGYQSHWLQPWRAYLETVPTTTFLDGLGMVFKVKKPANAELVAQMLAKHGIRQARFEVGWGQIDYDDETKLNKDDEIRTRLLALKKYGIRPLIVLNGNQGRPCPIKSFKRTLIEDASAGVTQIQLNDVSDLKVGYSGLSDLTDSWAAEVLITDISGNSLTLSKPLPKAIQAGTSISIDTLKYRPFSSPKNEDYQETIAGWLRYVDAVAQFAVGVLETNQSSDKGFDMEIWNELSFGSNFLKIDKYYAQTSNNSKRKKPKLDEYKQTEENLDDYQEKAHIIRNNIVQQTTAYAEAHPELFKGVSFSNGFASTIPWPASSLQPQRVVALSKHPYPKFRRYPQDENKAKPVNALYQVEDKSTFVPPTYSVLFPEYSATALQSSTIVRDMGSITSEIYGTKHGRNARVINGVVVPTSVWITEANVNPSQYDHNISAERASFVQAKTNARYACFFLNKGVTRLYLFAAGKEGGLGLVKQNFLDYSEKPNAIYPTEDSAYTSSTLTTLSRIVAKMSDQIDRNLTNPHQLEVASISDTHSHYQFTGDGTAAHPNLYNRDVFVFLPYQVNPRRFIIPYYVMTRDVMKDLPPEQFTVQIKGLKGTGASVSVYDPINDKDIPVVVNVRGSDSLSVTLTTTDYPYLLTVQEDT